MKRFLFSSLLAYALILASSSVDASENLRYVGFDAGQSYSKTRVHGFSSSERRLHSMPQFVNAYNGYRIGRYMAFEFGGFVSASMNGSKNHREGEAKSNGMFMGFVFLLPIGPKAEFCPGVGVAQVFSHINRPGLLDAKDDGIMPRLMFGVQYKLSDKLKVRASAVWHRMGGIYDNLVCQNNTVHMGIGLNYNFEPR